jgi:hypothetical protein
VIQISGNEIRLNDVPLKSADELRNELLKRQPCEATLILDHTAKYASVAAALRAIQAADCKLPPIIGNELIEPST